MFLVALFRFFSGMVVFQVSGGFLERFLNLCNVNGLKLWDIKRTGDRLTAATDIRSYKKMHICARKTGCVTKALEKKGAPFLLHRYRHRVGILLGLAVFAVVLAVLTSFIWVVEVEGNETLPTKEILQYYETQGLKRGAWRKDLDISYLENKGMADLPEIAWISINLYGSKAVIELREGVEAPGRTASEAPCNIKARRDGQIVRLNVLDGYPAVAEQDSVVKGDLLISAVDVSEATGIAFYKHAQGSVIARTEHILQEEIAGTQEIRTYTGAVKKRNYLLFFGLKIPLGLTKAPQGQYELEEEEVEWTIRGTLLPISFHRRAYKEYTAEQKPLTDEEMQQKAVEAMEKKLKDDPYIQSVEQAMYHLEHTEAGAIVTGTFQCLEEIGMEEAFVVEQAQEKPADTAG